MTKPAAAEGDDVIGTDIHIVMVPSPGGPVPTPTPVPFQGKLTGGLSADVLIENRAAATVDSTADNLPPHVPPQGTFQKPPTNKGVVARGSGSVLVNNRPLARAGDAVKTCGDPADQETSAIVCNSGVLVGD